MQVPAKIPHFVTKLYPLGIWQMPNAANKIYLTFDDGPTPEVTPWVLAELKKHNVLATFFLIGNNVEKHPEIVAQIREAGHSIGNHTYNHEKGWTTKNEAYFKSVATTNELLSTPLFRPPYGRIKKSQLKHLAASYSVIMWDVLSHDYNRKNTPEKCTKNVLNNVESGSVIVFHDSVKAWPNVQKSLPVVLPELQKMGFEFAPL